MRLSFALSIGLLITLFVGSALLLPTTVLSQEGGLIVVIDNIVADQYDSGGTIQAYITVRHPQGGAITELGPEAFTITLGDKTYVPAAAEVENTASVSLAIVLELFRTMTGDPFEQAKAAIGQLYTTKPPRDRVAFFGVRPGANPDSDEIDLEYEREFSNDGGAANNFVQSSIELVTSGNGTPLFDTLVRAIRFTAREPVGRSAIVVITDGGDVGSRYTAQTVIDAAEELRIPVYSIGYTGNDRIKDQFLNELANRTGGRYQDTPNAEDFGQFLAGVRDDVSQHYVLTIEPEALDSGRQVLEARVEAGGLFGTHSKHFDIQRSSATPAPPSLTTAIETEPTAIVAAATAEPTVASATPTTSAEAAVDSTDTGGNIVETILDNPTVAETIRDNPTIVAAAAGGLLLFFVILIVVAILMGRRKRGPEPAWDSEPDAFSPEFAQYDTAADYDQAQVASSVRRATEPDLPAGTQVAPSGAAVAPPPAGDFAPAPPMPAQAGFGHQAPPAAEEGTMIIDRGPRMTRQALLVDGQRPEVRYDVNKPVVTLGRSADNDIILDNATISRHHATIKLEQDEFRVYDLGSSNGTFVNEQQVIEPVAVKDGDTVRLGEVILILKIISLSD
jgi:hypothetical protein